MLDDVLTTNGLTRNDIWLTNIIKCRAASPKGDVLKNRPPKASEIKACSKWLDGELTLMQPSVILCAWVRLPQKCLSIAVFALRKNVVSGLQIPRMLPWLWRRLTLLMCSDKKGENFTALRQVCC